MGKDVGFSFGFNDCNHDEVVTDVLRALSEAKLKMGGRAIRTGGTTG
ncbi:hypothetical protein P4V41_20270 [Fictibacillus nanhaiensis]|nr:hypothetical protein [Fictibacillus nanhaiensis]